MNINTSRPSKVYATLPVLNEPGHTARVIHELLNQEYPAFEIIVCVNQPSEWWYMSEKREACENNQATIDYIKKLNNPIITCIDKSSPGKGWVGSKHGVGWARKVAMDVASEKASDDDIILSVDADTSYYPEYFKSVVDSFKNNKSAVGFSAPYYHPLTGDELTDRCILRYEIYMRNYGLNMLLIENPYRFSAIGSGMACTGKIYRKVRGITPKMSGEDFYFIQKLRKLGPVIIDNDEIIYPASRFSNRVYFGTGPAMIKGSTGNWSSYPIYEERLFKHVKETFDLFPRLYKEEIATPMDESLYENNEQESLWEPLRNNCSSVDRFVKAAHQKVDALRILQYLKDANQTSMATEEDKLARFIKNNFNPGEELVEILDSLDFDNTTVPNLNLIRDFMFVNERKLQREAKVA